jgi:ribosomal-protein-alanine N-acetyltransferase
MNTKFAFDDFPVLQTERFTLRAAREQDSPDILALYSDERVAQYLPLDPFETMDDAMGELGWYTKIFVEKSGLRWMIEDAKSTKVIGTCGFLNREDVHNRAEIGYDLHPDYWGRGVMTEVARSIIHFGFVNMQLNKIEAKADPQNKGSIALLKKLGFQQEGLLREHEFEKGRYVDLAVFSLLKSEFQAKTDPC